MAKVRRDARVSRGAVYAFLLTIVSACTQAACRHDTINIFLEGAGNGASAVMSGRVDAGSPAAAPPAMRAPAAPGLAATRNDIMTSSPAVRAGSAGQSAGVQGVAAGSGARPPVPEDSGWWMMGYDERNWYWNPTEHTLSVANAKQLKELWRANVMSTPNGTPVIADNKVFVTSGAGVFALELTTGKPVWMRADISGTSSLAYAAGPWPACKTCDSLFETLVARPIGSVLQIVGISINCVPIQKTSVAISLPASFCADCCTHDSAPTAEAVMPLLSLTRTE